MVFWPVTLGRVALHWGWLQCAQATKTHCSGQESEARGLAEDRSAARTTQHQAPLSVHAALPERHAKTVSGAASLGVAEIKGHAV
jgi:hypothetical protein